MFGFLMTQAARARRDAKNWLEVADKVHNYRRDELNEADLGELNLRRQELRAKVKRKADASEIKLGIEALEAVLHRVGGRVYPKGALADNVEFFLAAAIVILGIRAFFVQPFKIPTNSMWPSYFGMKHEVFVDPAQAPGPVAQLFRFAAFGATRRTVVAPVDGELRIPLRINAEGKVFVPTADRVAGRKWLVLPTVLMEYTLFVGSEPVRFRVPGDFDFNTLIQDTYFEGRPDVRGLLADMEKAGRLEQSHFTVQRYDRREQIPCLMLKTGRKAARGQAVFAFDVLTGDQLFVDRFSYHFFKPGVGEGFVFRTARIKGIGEDQFYIKRLVGTPGDVLEIREPVLYRNGSPIEGAAGFANNATRSGLYRGYHATEQLAPGLTVTVPKHCYYAIGDNSYNSRDSRYWGFVPDKDVMGRPLFIYYPLSKRWGPSR